MVSAIKIVSSAYNISFNMPSFISFVTTSIAMANNNFLFGNIISNLIGYIPVRSKFVCLIDLPVSRNSEGIQVSLMSS